MHDKKIENAHQPLVFVTSSGKMKSLFILTLFTLCMFRCGRAQSCNHEFPCKFQGEILCLCKFCFTRILAAFVSYEQPRAIPMNTNSCQKGFCSVGFDVQILWSINRKLFLEYQQNANNITFHVSSIL